MNVFFYQNESIKVQGLAQALQLLGHNVNFVSKELGLFNLIEYNKPDIIFFADDTCPTEHVAYAKNDYPNLKTVLITKGTDTPKEYDYVVHLNDTESESYLDFLANDVYCNGEEKDDFKTDILFMTDSHDVQSENVIKSINSLGQKYKLKAYGSNRLPSINYLGQLNQDQVKDAIASSKIVVMFNNFWLNTVLKNKKVPLIHGQAESEDSVNFCFNGYKKLDDLCELHLNDYNEVKLNKEIKTYTDFCKNILERI